MRTFSLCIALLLAAAAPAAAQRSLACGPRGITLAVGDSARLHAAAIDLLGRLRSDAAVLWGSLDEDVATVNAEGMVRARAAGRALVWCAWAVGPHLDTLFVQVTEPPPPPPPPQDEEEPPPASPPASGPEPWVLDDFSTYTSTEHLRSDP